MEIGTKVQVGRKGLMSTDWIGIVTKVEGHLRVVKFPARDKPLKYNVHSLKRVPVAPKKPEVDERFEIKQVRELTFERRGYYHAVYKGVNGKLQVNRLHITQDTVDNLNQCITYHGQSIKFDDIVYLAYVGGLIKFKRPQRNQYPFYVFDEDEVERRFRDFKLEDGEYNLIKSDRYELRIDWLADKKVILPNFKVTYIKVLKEGFVIGEDEVFNEAIEKMRKGNRTAKGNNNCFGIVFRNPIDGVVTVKDTFGRPCHAMLNSMARAGVDIKQDVQFAFQYICRGLNNYKHRDEWLMYVMNESPWARYCITKTMEEALDSGIRVRTDIPCNALMCTFYALRYPYEYPNVINAWKEYCDAGMNKAMAFFAAETELFKDNSSGHHRLLDTYSMDLDSLIKFAKCEVGGIIEEDYNKCRRYRNVSMHHGCNKLRDNAVDKGTAIESLHKLDIFGAGEVAGGVFGGGGGRKVSLEKAIKVTNELLQG